MRFPLFTTLIILATSCTGQEENSAAIQSPNTMELPAQIDDYVVDAFQDSKGNLWFGTLEKGVARYDGSTLRYLTTQDGLPSNRVVSIIEDASGVLWFGTGAGLSKFDGTTFVNYSEKEGLCSDMVSNLFIDSKGNFWIGTWGGVCKFDGTAFENFPIPYPEIETYINPDTKNWITSIAEDSSGAIWFGRDGYGASRFDGKSFVHYTTTDGLNSNNVQAILDDREGNIWIGTRVGEKDNPDANKKSGKGGLNRYDGEKFIHFPQMNGLSENDVYALYLDASNHVWIGTTSSGVYRYANNAFTHYDVPKSTMDFSQDSYGNMWLGCAGGLYRINSAGEVLNITTNGPWK
jgi:ligand-binding sensor domain-containing protein